jgi:hypothetical protein
MNHLHPGFALALMLEAFLVLWLLRRWIRIDLAEGHSPAIDGLRGFWAECRVQILGHTGIFFKPLG